MIPGILWGFLSVAREGATTQGPNSPNISKITGHRIRQCTRNLYDRLRSIFGIHSMPKTKVSLFYQCIFALLNHHYCRLSITGGYLHGYFRSMNNLCNAFNILWIIVEYIFIRVTVSHFQINIVQAVLNILCIN